MLEGPDVHRSLDAAAQHRCRLCSVNDEAALVEQLAAELWSTIPEDGRSWEQAGDYWQDAFRRHAETAVRLLRS